MKKIFIFLLCLYWTATLTGLEVYKTHIYPGAVNHWNSAFSYGLFSINTMESSSRSITIKRTLAFNNSTTQYQYSYDREGRLTGYTESTSYDGGDPVSEGTYEYSYKDQNLSSVRLNGEDIYFPTPYFISIRQGGDELTFELEKNGSGEISAIVQQDENGTKYFFVEGLLRSIESVGPTEAKSMIQYEYNEDSTLSRYRSEVIEGRGQSRKVTKYDFRYRDGSIQFFLMERSGRGQDYSRIRCEFEHITEDDGTPVMSFALDDEGNIILTAKYEYENANRYTIEILNERDLILERIVVEKQ